MVDDAINVDFLADSRILAPNALLATTGPRTMCVRLRVRVSRLSAGQRVVAILIGPYPLPQGLPHTEAKVPDRVEWSVHAP